MRITPRLLWRQSLGFVLAASALAIVTPGSVHAQPAPRSKNVEQTNDFGPFTPEQLFDQIFGPRALADDEALADIEISLREERQIGDAAAQDYLNHFRRRKLKILNRGREVAYLRDLVTTLQPLMDHAKRYRNIEVYYVESDETDARSFPGGTLFFSRGLLKFAESEAAMIGVVGHELSHLDRGHQLIHAKRMKLAQQTFANNAAPVSPERFFQTGQMMAAMWMRPFRPEDESEADSDGAKWSFEAGYDPREFAELLLKMHRRDGQVATGLPTFLRSHPFHIDRYKAIMSTANDLDKHKPRGHLYVGRRNLKERVARIRRSFDE